jgi:hypothetical protein
MSNPFSGFPKPETPRPPSRRRFQPGVAQEALREMMQSAKQGLQKARRYGEDLWLRGKRNPRMFAIAGGVVAVTLVGAYAVSASGAGRSLCAAAQASSKAQKSRTTPRFLLLMDPVPHLEAGSEVEISYDVCGLREGTPYRGRVRLSQQPPVKKKKKSAAPKPLIVTFQDQVDGLATRRSQQLDLGATKPGTYTLELTVVDNQGRERKRLQKVRIKAQQ